MVSPAGNQQQTFLYNQQLLRQANPNPQNMWVNTINPGTRINPQDVAFMANKSLSDAAQAAKDAQCADGKDDGSIGFWKAAGHLLKGGLNFITGMFTDENGDFSIGQTFKSLAIAAAVVGATFIPVVGPLVIPALCTVGMVHGGLKVAEGIGTAITAETDAEAEKAWEEIGSGVTEGAISYYGYKASGGLKNGWEAAKAEYTARYSTAETAAPTELSTSEIEVVSDQNVVEPPKTTLERAKAKEPQVRQKNPLAEQARYDRVNELADKVNRGESINPTNEEISIQGQNLNTQHLKSNDAKLVEQAYRDVPTAEQQAAYDQAIAYKKASPQRVKAFKEKGGKFVKNEGPNATQSMSEIQVQRTELTPGPKAPETLADVKTTLVESAQKGIADGKYYVEYADGKYGTYTVKDGSIVKADVPELNGKITDLKLAKHYDKYNILDIIAKDGQNVITLAA